MDIAKIKIELEELLQDLEQIMDKRDLEQVKYFIGYNEIKLAVETLCEYLSEDEICLNSTITNKINEVCLKLNIEKIYWM